MRVRRRTEQWLGAADEVTRCFTMGGEDCIAALASQVGQPPVSLLCSLLQQAANATRVDGRPVACAATAGTQRFATTPRPFRQTTKLTAVALGAPTAADRDQVVASDQRVDAYGDHALACPRKVLFACRAEIVERAWVHVAREAVRPEGPVVPQQWLAHTTVPGVPSPLSCVQGMHKRAPPTMTVPCSSVPQTVASGRLTQNSATAGRQGGRKTCG